MKIEKKRELVRVCVKVYKDQRKKLDKICTKTGKTMSAIVREIFEDVEE